jgi:hypothetical protein
MERWIEKFVGQNVVLDTQGPLIYLGRLEQVGPSALVLIEADVHDRSDGRASKEEYMFESKVHGVRVNRRSVIVKRSEIASISLLDDVQNHD